MKLQIEKQHLRLRVDEAELAKLLQGDAIVTHTRFAQAFSMACTLRLTPALEARIAGQSDTWEIEVPRADVTALAERLPSRDGLRFMLPTQGGDDALTLLFDVDVRDSARRRKAT